MAPVVPLPDKTLEFGSFRLIPSQHLLLKGGETVRIGSRALLILTALVEQPGVLISKSELIKRVWPNTIVEDSNLKVHVAALRRLLGDRRDGGRYLVNIPGRGYKFVAPVVHLPMARGPGAVVAEPYYYLPPPRTQLVGRAESVRLLVEQVAQHRLINVVGPGGVGKTSVALAVARAVLPSFQSGVCFVDLAPVADPKLVPSAVATSLGVAVHSEDPVPVLVDFLGGKGILIILDSCEHVVDSSAALSETLIRALPKLRILATSRVPLQVLGERLLRLPSLSTPEESNSLTAHEALTFSSVELFVARAFAQLEHFRLSDEDAPFVGEICRRLDGNALAIEMAAGRVGAFGIRGVASLLDDRFKILSSTWRNALPRHQTLMVALDWSYELLSETERSVLRRLGAFAGYFSLGAATQVAAGGSVSPSDVIAAIANLVNQSLVSAEVGGTIPQYRLLDTTRAYAREKLLDEGEFGQVAQRHVKYCHEFLLQTYRQHISGDMEECVSAYVGQVANVRVALDWSFSPDGDTAAAVALTIASVPLWLSRSLIEECRKRVERALECVAPGGENATRQEMQLLTALGVVLYSQGPTPVSKQTWTKVLDIAHLLGDDDYQIRALWGLWVVCVTGGNHQEGLTLAREFLALAQHRANAVDLPVGSRLVGTSLHFLGQQRQAKLNFEVMLNRPLSRTSREQIVRFQFDQAVAGRAFYSRILWLQGFPDQAVRAARESVSEAQAQEHALSLCYALGQAACPVSLFTGDLDSADASITLLIDSAAKHFLPLWQSMGRCFKGILWVRQGEMSPGLRLLRESSDELRAAGFALYHTAALIELAQCLGQTGDFGLAFATIEQAMAQAREHQEHWCLPEIMRVKGEILLLQLTPNRESEVERYFTESFNLAHKQEALSWQLRAAMSLARFQHVYHRSGQGSSVLARTYAAFTEGFGTTDLAAAKQLLIVIETPS